MTTKEPVVSSTVAPTTCLQLSGQWCTQCSAANPIVCTACVSTHRLQAGSCVPKVGSAAMHATQMLYLAFIVILATVLMIFR